MNIQEEAAFEVDSDAPLATAEDLLARVLDDETVTTLAMPVGIVVLQVARVSPGRIVASR